ncbi:MAG: DUF2019 domain-containing protein [Xanthobacteraceae bacterium]|uniref:DUF2019 domain-containing protein n=1 Tax=Pseudolabrys sp. TaxID=1960880 RepID=UPI003D0DB1FC
MTVSKLVSSSTNDLVKEFVETALGQDRAELHGDISEVNRLYARLKKIEAELKSRAGDQRRALMPLYYHSNAQVRLKAATATLAIAPVEAREVLERIQRSKEFPQAGEAGMRLWNIDRGVFKPT